MIAYVGAAIVQRSVEECEATVRPNNIVYTDHTGAEHSIYIPTGTFDTAAEHFANADWDALNKFPAWSKLIMNLMFKHNTLTRCDR